MEDKKGFNRSEPQTKIGPKGVMLKIGLIALSLILAVFTVIVINI